ALVADLVVGNRLALASAPFDGSLNVVLWHAHGAGLVDRVAQLQVHHGITAAVAGGDDDCAAELAPEPAPDGVHLPLLVLDVRPVGMSCHLSSLSSSDVRPCSLPLLQLLQQGLVSVFTLAPGPSLVKPLRLLPGGDRQARLFEALIHVSEVVPH